MTETPPFKLSGTFERILDTNTYTRKFYQFTDWRDTKTGREYTFLTRKELWIDNLLSVTGEVSHNGRDAQIRSIRHATTEEQKELVGGVVGLRGPLFYDQELGVQRWSVATMDERLREYTPNLAVVAIPFWYTVSHPNNMYILIRPTDYRDVMVRHILPSLYWDGKDWLY